MRLVYAIALGLSPIIASAQSVAEFDLTSIDLDQVAIAEGFVVRDQVPHFVSLRCPTCDGLHTYAIRINVMTLAEWAGAEFKMPRQVELEAMCAAEMEAANERSEVLEACEIEFVSLPASLAGMMVTMTVKAGVLGEWKSFETAAVIVHDSGVIRIGSSDDDKERGLQNVDALTLVIADAVSAELND